MNPIVEMPTSSTRGKIQIERGSYGRGGVKLTVSYWEVRNGGDPGREVLAEAELNSDSVLALAGVLKNLAEAGT